MAFLLSWLPRVTRIILQNSFTTFSFLLPAVSLIWMPSSAATKLRASASLMEQHKRRTCKIQSTPASYSASCSCSVKVTISVGVPRSETERAFYGPNSVKWLLSANVSAWWLTTLVHCIYSCIFIKRRNDVIFVSLRSEKRSAVAGVQGNAHVGSEWKMRERTTSIMGFVGKKRWYNQNKDIVTLPVGNISYVFLVFSIGWLRYALSALSSTFSASSAL